MKNKSRFNIGTGVTSLIMIFVVLCLTTFAILSFAQAKSDYKLSLEAANNISAYYQARNKIVRNISEINELITNIKKSQDKTNFNESIVEEVENLGFSINENGVIICKYEIDEKQSFICELVIIDYDDINSVEVKSSYIKSNGGDYEEKGIELVTFD